MTSRRAEAWTRRGFLGGLAVSGAAGLFGLDAPAAAEPPPETTRLKLLKFPSLCLAPQYVAEELLRGEGFTEVRYLEFPEEGIAAYGRVASGELDISQGFIAPSVVQVDQGAPIVFLAGVDVGCFELFAAEGVRAIEI